jgi:hypothetical protein
MPGHSRLKDGVASLAYVPGTHVFLMRAKDVDGRDKPGHDGCLGYLADQLSQGFDARRSIISQMLGSGI